jgi:hypothetical protein
MYVFRHARRIERGRRMLDELAADLRRLDPLRGTVRSRAVLGALIRAGEIEAAFADEANQPELETPAGGAARVTDALADELLLGQAAPLPDAATGPGTSVPDCVRVSPHEGFAYYALHPRAFARMAQQAAAGERKVAVVGIRSIGTTLSAVVAAALRSRGTDAQRITVRPGGHPYARSLALSEGARAWAGRNADAGVLFLVADEGPGFSGSSFLAVGEALVACGIPAQRVVFLCSRAIDPMQLVAVDAAARWSRFRSCAAPAHWALSPEFGRCLELRAGEWRKLVYDAESEWPASWTQLERLKLFSSDRTRLLKFEGLGPYGLDALRRARTLFEAGWGPQPVDEGDGFVSYALAGRPLRREELCGRVMASIAQYCADRASLFPATSCSNGDELTEMLRANVLTEFGRDLPPAFVPALERPIVADARMLPHEWLRSPCGALVKVDAVAHGDDHVFPGPTDIAWDLAGTIVEWQLDDAGRAQFLECYRRASGDDGQPRLGPYVFAYAVFRMAYCKMAAAALGPGGEAARLEADYRGYRAFSCREAARSRFGSEWLCPRA